MKKTTLDGLSMRQQSLVERNLPLVHLTLGRRRGLWSEGRCGRERSELFQEGCIALAEAVRSHDPARHGPFAPYAMARIHFAVSSYALEQSSAIRVPFIAQRRRQASVMRDEKCAAKPGKQLADAADIRIGRRLELRDRAADRRTLIPQESAGDERPTLGELLRERLDAAAERVAADMRGCRRCRSGTAELIDLCLRERWIVPEPEAKTPIRRLARQFDCSIGRVTHGEARFRRKMAKSLESDAVFVELRRLAKSHPDGLQRRVSDEEMERLVRGNGKDARHDPR